MVTDRINLMEEIAEALLYNIGLDLANYSVGNW